MNESGISHGDVRQPSLLRAERGLLAAKSALQLSKPQPTSHVCCRGDIFARYLLQTAASLVRATMSTLKEANIYHLAYHPRLSTASAVRASSSCFPVKATTSLYESVLISSSDGTCLSRKAKASHHLTQIWRILKAWRRLCGMISRERATGSK